MRPSSRFILYVLLAVAGFQSCKPGRPSELIPEDKLEDLLYDYHVAQALADAERDSMELKRYSYVLAVFDKYGVTEAEFDSTMLWYSTHASLLNDIYKRLDEKFEGNVSALSAATGEAATYASLGEQGDTANIWRERTFRVLKPQIADDRIQFFMEADSTFLRGDELMWRFDPRYISSGGSNEAYAALYVKYDNDSVAGLAQRVYSNSPMQIRLQGDTAHAIRAVGGFVYYKPDLKDNGFRMLILDHIMLVRFHMHIEPVVPDTVTAEPDSMAIVDSVAVHPVQPGADHRLTPTELRDGRSVERSIHVVKEKPYRPVRRNGNGTRRTTTTGRKS